MCPRPGLLSSRGLSPSHLAFVSLSVGDLSAYAGANAEYVAAFPGPNPPARACFEAPITRAKEASTAVRLSAVGFKPEGVSAYLTCDAKF